MTPPPDDKNTASDSQMALLQQLVGKLHQLVADASASGLVDRTSLSVDLDLKSPGAAGGMHWAISVGPNQSAAPEAALSTAREEFEAQLSFNTEGHQVIALIAARDLAERAPQVMQIVQRLLDEGDRTIEEAAVFPDDIRRDQPETAPFHFVDIPFQEDGPVNPRLPRAPHVLTELVSVSTALRNGGNAQEKVDNLSWLIHLFGDVHQPLHCIERRSELHPGGDRGGNSFRLSGPKRNLHSLWDSSVNVSAPLGEDQLAADIIQQHSRGSLANDLNVTDPEAWARNSFKLAKQHAYSLEENPSNPPRPTRTYIQNMERIGRKQAALAGYRLADRLIQIFS